MSALEVFSYLTDPTFATVVVLGVCVFAALEVVNWIGGAK